MQKYAFEEEKYNKNTMARAKLLYQNISTKDSIEIAKAIRGKSLEKSLEMLKKVVEKKQPIKYTRFIQESAGHKPGIGSGKYPVKAAEAFISLLELVKSNAEQKSLDEEKLFIIHVKADKASRPWRYGRHRGRKAKRTHLEIVVEEKEVEKKENKNKKSEAKKVEKSTQKSTTEKTAKKATKESKKTEETKEKTETKKTEEKVEEKTTTEEKKENKNENKEEKPIETKKEQSKSSDSQKTNEEKSQ